MPWAQRTAGLRSQDVERGLDFSEVLHKRILRLRLCDESSRVGGSWSQPGRSESKPRREALVVSALMCHYNPVNQRRYQLCVTQPDRLPAGSSCVCPLCVCGPGTAPLVIPSESQRVYITRDVWWGATGMIVIPSTLFGNTSVESWKVCKCAAAGSHTVQTVHLERFQPKLLTKKTTVNKKKLLTTVKTTVNKVNSCFNFVNKLVNKFH